MITVYGVLALSFMMLMYLFEKRSPIFVLAFAAGCTLCLAFGVVVGVWTGVAFHRWYLVRTRSRSGSEGEAGDLI